MSRNSKAPMPADHRRQSAGSDNPKVNPDTADNQIKNPEDWVTGDEPMTGAQASYLKTLSEQAHEPDAFDPGLDKAEASKRIDQLKEHKRR